MKKPMLIISLLLATAISMNARKTDSPNFVDPYLGQEPSGRVPEMFTPAIVSLSGPIECSSGFPPDGKQFCFNRIRKDTVLDYTMKLIEE